ncbi:YdcF family protein [Oscillospiraceae bacterium PP1C4]
MKRFFKLCCIILALVALAFGLLPLLVYGIFHTGVAAMLLFGGLLLAVTLLWDAFSENPQKIYRRLRAVSDHSHLHIPRWWKLLRTAICVVLIIAFTGGCILSALMVRAALCPPPQGEHTVVVLGCQVVGDRPSTMLQRRLDTASAYLTAHPDAAVVCAGGLNDDGPFSEAAVMKQYLLKQGIAQNRIYLEDRSRNTDENIRFTAQIIAQNALAPSLAISTDGFHQLRAFVYAEKNGLPAFALSAPSPWGLLPAYWVREWFGLVKAVLF